MGRSKIILEVNKISVWVAVLHCVTVFHIAFKRKTDSLVPKASKDVKQKKYLILCKIFTQLQLMTVE